MITLLPALGPSTVWGNGFRNPPEGAAAVSRTGGRIVWTEDATATVHNPANLAGMADRQVLAALAIGYNGVEFVSPDGRSGETESPWKFLPSLFAVQPLRDGRVVLGIGVSSPFGQFAEYDRDSSPFGPTAPFYARERTIDVTPTIGVRLNNRLRVGAGLNVMHSQLKFEQLIPFASLTGDPATPFGLADIEVDGVGVGGHFGVTWDPLPRHRFAATYRTEIEIDHDGDFEVRGIPAGLAGRVVRRTDFETQFSFPAILGLSYGWRLRDSVRLGVDVEWVEASVFDDLPLEADANQFLLPGLSVPEDWNDNWTSGVGLEWDATADATWYAGYLFMETPVPEETLAPSLVDANRHILSIGLRHVRRRHAFEVGYAYIFFEDLTIERNVQPAYVGSYDPYAQVVSLSYRLSF